MAHDFGAWTGSLRGSRSNDVELRLEAVLGESEGGGSGSFPASASDQARWYVKPQNNGQGPKVIVTEYLVSAAGELVGAPVCEVQPIAIPHELAGHRFVTGIELQAGIASASRAVGDCVEDRSLLHRNRDDNARRHAGIFALFDWCWGGDVQWLYQATAESRIYSHDHGWYLPPEGPSWTIDQLVATVDHSHALGLPTDGLDAEELDRLADALEAIGESALSPVLRAVPTDWPVTDEELEAVGWYLERRAAATAGRMRDMAGKIRGTP